MVNQKTPKTVSTHMAKQGKKYTTDKLDFLKEKVCERNLAWSVIACSGISQWKLPKENFKMAINVTNTGQLIEISIKHLEPLAETLDRTKFLQAWQDKLDTSKILIVPPHQVQPKSHSQIVYVDNVVCVSLPFFILEQKEQGKELEL